MTLLEKFSEYACGMKFEDLPNVVVKKANDVIFDLIGCYYGAIKNPSCKQIFEKTPIYGNEAILWGTGKRTLAEEVALVCGYLGYSLEYDDGVSLGGHWGSASIPATIAIAEKYGRSGKDVICSVSIAYEIGTRISRLYSSILLERKIHFPCTMGFFAAAASVGKLMKLDKTLFAMGLAGAALAPIGPYSTAVGGGRIKNLYSGWPNFLAVRMMKYASDHIGGTTDLFESKNGLGVVFSGHQLTNDEFETATKNLGTQFMLMETYFKPYPCCRWLHAPLFLLQQALKKIVSKDFLSITVSGPGFLSLYDIRDDYSEKVKAQYSIPYTMAAMLIRSKCGVEEFGDAFRTSKEICQKTKIISIEKDNELDSLFPEIFKVRLKIVLQSGEEHIMEGGLPWSPECPATTDELVTKFENSTANVLPNEIQKSFINIYKNGIENGNNFEKLLKLLSVDVLSRIDRK